MSHPPIPPNCDMFYEPESKTGPYWIINNLAVTSICLHDHDKDDRKVIAAVARCAFLDACIAVYERYDLDAEEAFELAQPLEDNAESWRLWGLNKWK